MPLPERTHTMTPYNASDMLRAMDRNLGTDALPDPTTVQTGDSRLRRILVAILHRA